MRELLELLNRVLAGSSDEQLDEKLGRLSPAERRKKYQDRMMKRKAARSRKSGSTFRRPVRAMGHKSVSARLKAAHAKRAQHKKTRADLDDILFSK